MAKMKHIVKSWEAAEELFRRHARRPKHGGDPRVNLGYATWLHQRNLPEHSLPDYAVKFHATDVVTYHPDGVFTLDTGGWLTVTTRERIRAFTPAVIAVHTSNVPARNGNPPRFEISAWDIGAGQHLVWDMTQQDSVTINPQELP